MQEALLGKIAKLDSARANPRNYAMAKKLIKELVGGFNAYELTNLVSIKRQNFFCFKYSLN